MLSVGREPIQFVSEEYCQDASTRSATFEYDKQPPFRSIHMEAQLASHTPRKINDLNSCFKFKLSERIGDFG
jgi:hypothetical protein